MSGDSRSPSQMHVIADLRDVRILEMGLPNNLTQRLAVIFDHDRDQRVIDVLQSISFRAPHFRANLIALAESGGDLTLWYGDAQTLDAARRPFQEATTAALWPYDNWRVKEVILAPVHDGVLVRDELPARDLLQAAPARYVLGLVRS